MGDMTAHGGPLAPGPPSPNVLIGGQPAWLGMSAAGAAALASTFSAGMANIATATAANAAAAGTPGAPAAAANLTKTIADSVANMAAQMAGSGASINACPVVKVVVPDGPGVVITPSQTVLINGMGACRVGDTIQEATSVNTIAQGLPSVIIGG
jgi:uncharacterized Zn-binding protein involved in type VI secretion